MHRTQILLEEDHYQALISRARREGRSMAAVVRDVIAKALDEPAANAAPGGLTAAKGLFRARGVHGRDHNRIIYGT